MLPQPNFHHNFLPLQPSRRYINPNNPYLILVIGPPGHGKSSFIPHLMELTLLWGEKPAEITLWPAISDLFTIHSIEVSTSNYINANRGQGELVMITCEDWKGLTSSTGIET